MLITRRAYTETIETETIRLRNNVMRWYFFGVPIFTRKDEVWTKGAKVSDELRRKVLHLDHYECVYCGACGPKVILSIDHRVPQIEGGITTESNLLTACKPCNSAKHGRTPEDAIMPLRFGRFRDAPAKKVQRPIRSIGLTPEGERLVSRIKKAWEVLICAWVSLCVCYFAYAAVASQSDNPTQAGLYGLMSLLSAMLLFVLRYKIRHTSTNTDAVLNT